MDKRPLFMPLTELHRRTSLTLDRRPEKGGETLGRTSSKVLKFWQWLVWWMEKEGPDYVLYIQERTGHSCGSCSHGMTLQLRHAAVMIDSRHSNTKVDQLITVTTQAGITIKGRRLRLGITSSPDGPTRATEYSAHTKFYP